jgi:UDP-N-acetylglucosamine 1-carboxyvinyltransferase
MSTEYISLEKSPPLRGSVPLIGAKNAVLVTMASLILTRGKNRLTNVPFSEDVKHMIRLLELLGAHVEQNKQDHILIIDTESIKMAPIGDDIMRKMRASILVMGPLLARFLEAHVALPGGCVLGARPIDYHIQAFKKMGVQFSQADDFLHAHAVKLEAVEHVLSYPSVGATENIMMAATLAEGTTRIVNAALEPEIFDLIVVLKKMGAHIEIKPPAVIEITGVKKLETIDHEIMYDRLEAGTLILAAAITGGAINLPDAPAASMTVFLSLLEEMGHSVTIGSDGVGIQFRATTLPRAVSFKTMPYPGFPTDLQAPMMAVLCRSSGTSVVHETVFENRLMHVRELQKMGAQITHDGQVATVIGVDELYGASVIATDIRAGAALLIAGLAAEGTTTLSGIHHLTRGYDDIVSKLISLGGRVQYVQPK